MRYDYKLFGKSNLRVSGICPGTLTFDGEWGHGISREENRKIFEAFVEAEGN
jgi:aryl-alcohol dehydrogenase-like predicted oxidoreductase